jgi:hypothetical protein
VHSHRVVSNLKWLFPLFLLAAAMLLPAPVSADEVTLAGYTSGTFAGTGDFSSTGLQFTGNPDFDVTTSGGLASISLGSLSLPSTASIGTYFGTFSLDVTFTVPTGILGGNTSSFTANLLGNVTNSTTGAAILLNFSPALNFYSFSNGTESGSFILLLPSSESVAIGSATPLTASILNASETGAPMSAPEPGTLLLTGLGILGLFALRYKYGAQALAVATQA